MLWPFTVQHISASLAQKETVHPVFDLSLAAAKSAACSASSHVAPKARMTSSSMTHCMGRSPVTAASSATSRGLVFVRSDVAGTHGISYNADRRDHVGGR
jgi:hypothetical protein